MKRPATSLKSNWRFLWREVLGVERVGIHDNFFELGGHSLKAVTLASRIHQLFNIELPLTEIFQNPTIGELSKCVHIGAENCYSSIQPVAKQEYYPSGYYPTSSAQKKLYILHQIPETGLSYNMTGATVIEGELDRTRLEKTFTELVRRHQSFRTSFHIINGEPVQYVHPDIPFTVDFLETDESGVNEAITGFVRLFDLNQPPLLRIKLLKISGDGKHLLIYDMPHIIADGVSLAILTREFLQLYNGQELPPLKINYPDFAVWQNNMLESGAMIKYESYWLKRLGGEIPLLNMPMDYPRPAKRNFKGNRLRFVITNENTRRIMNFANRQKVTPNMLLFTIYALLINKYSDQSDLIIGSLVSGRQHPDLERIIGVFINFLPIRINLNPEVTFPEFLEAVKQELLAAYENQNYPFEMIVAKRKAKVEPSRNHLFDTMLVYHSEFDAGYSQVGMELNNLKFYPYEIARDTATLDLKLDIIHTVNTGELVCFLEYDTALFKRETIAQLVEKFQFLCESVEIIKVISGLNLFTATEQQELAVKRNQPAGRPQATKLAVSATFTAEPIQEYIEWWLRQFGETITIEFAPYNQVFQELLDPSSLLATNSDLNLLLVRFEDWLRDDPAPPERFPAKLEQNFTELVAAFRNRNHQAVYLVALFPVSNAFSWNPPVMAKLAELNIRWREEITASNQAYPVDLQRLASSYQIAEIYDPVKDRIGHLPFSDGYYAAMGTVIARKIISWKQPRFKVIVLDCDQTLWQGICGEDGALGVTVTGPHAVLQRLLAQQCREGMLLALCSKNNEADVWEVFAANPGMILRKEDLAGWRINWLSKSENLQALARELNLGLDSFIFIDDNPMECAAVMAICPEVLTLRLPEEPRWFSGYLNHVWAFDRFRVTAEDQQRTRMYQEEKQRRELQTESLNLTDFLQRLELKVSLTLMEPAQLSRVAQLTQRTNQFNLSTIRRTEAEIQALTGDSQIKCWVVEVADRFGAYGLVGVIITREESPDLVLDTLLLSCRVLGKNVEEAILSGLQRYGRERKLRAMTARYFPTAKNEPFLKFLERTGWERRETTTDSVTYQLAIDPSLNRWRGLNSIIKNHSQLKPEPKSPLSKRRLSRRLPPANRLMARHPVSRLKIGQLSRFPEPGYCIKAISCRCNTIRPGRCYSYRLRRRRAGARVKQP